MLFVFDFCARTGLSASLDSLKQEKRDSVKVVKMPYKIIPRQATLKSLMIPGWGSYTIGNIGNCHWWLVRLLRWG